MFDPANPIRNPQYQDLAQPVAVAAQLEYMQQSVLTERTYEALLSSKFVRQWLQTHPEYLLNTEPLYEQLRTVLVDNTWMALNMLKDEAVVADLFDKQLLAVFTLAERYAFEYPTDDLVQRVLLDGMRGYLLNYMLFEDRDRIKHHLMTVLESSHTVLTSAPFYLEIKQSPPTLQNWFTVYKKYMGPAIESTDRRNKFLKISDNGAVLNDAERQRLECIFLLYYRFSLSSLNPLGMEEEVSYTDGEESGIFLYGEQFAHDTKTVKTIRELVDSANPNANDQVVLRPPVSSVSSKFNPNYVVPGPDVQATKGPDHFTDSDETEIQRHAEGVSGLAKPTKSDADYLQVASDIKQSVALSFATPEQDKRFTDLIVSVLRGLRDTMELKEYLVDLSFPTSDADAVVAAVNQQLVTAPNAASDRRAGKVPAPKLAGKPTLAQITKITDLSPASGHPSLAREGTSPAFSPPSLVREGTGERSELAKTFLPKLRRSRTQKRQIIDDVRLQPSMVMGPIDELRAMDTLEFRRLSPDPNQAAARLRDKVELLSEESIVKQAQGVDAFKQSPLNMLYLALGNESIASGKEVTAIIAEHDATGTPSLSVAEFNAIADLNRRLRF